MSAPPHAARTTNKLCPALSDGGAKVGHVNGSGPEIRVCDPPRYDSGDSGNAVITADEELPDELLTCIDRIALTAKTLKVDSGRFASTSVNQV